MNKSMLMGVALGVAVATAGGVVAGYQFLGKPAQEHEAAVTATEPAPAMAGTAAAPAARPTTQPATVQEECWDEEVVVQAEPRDDKQIAGTAIGAVVGGAVARDLGDRDLTTAVGAAAGAYVGRRAQQRFQENRTTTVVERRCAPSGSR